MDEIISKLQPYAKEIGAALLVVLLAIIFLGMSIPPRILWTTC